jgi:hypothetical protein
MALCRFRIGQALFLEGVLVSMELEDKKRRLGSNPRPFMPCVGKKEETAGAGTIEGEPAENVTGDM